MDTCEICGAWFVKGDPCEVCGHVITSATPARPSDPRARAAESEAPGSEAEKVPIPEPVPATPTIAERSAPSSPNQMLILVAATAAFVIAAGFSFLFFTGGDSDAPETLAVIDEDTTGTSSVVPASFCESPGPVADAPLPSADGVNKFVTFEKLGALRFDEATVGGMFDQQWFEQDYPELRLDSLVPTEPTYAACFTGLGNGEDRVCAGYGSGGQFEIYGADWTMDLYELASGESILADVAVRSEISVCPDIRPGLSRNQGPRASHVRQLTAFAALPGHYTAIHLTQDLDGGATTWCDSPSRVRQVGAKAGTPAVFLVTNGSQALRTAEALVTTSTTEIDRITHIACLRHEADTRRGELTCSYDNENLVKFERGTYTVTIVEAATGRAVEQRTFDSDISCPENFDFAHVGVHRLRGALPADAAAWIDSVVAEPEEEEEDLNATERDGELDKEPLEAD